MVNNDLDTLATVVLIILLYQKQGLIVSICFVVLYGAVDGPRHNFGRQDYIVGIVFLF